MLRSRRNFALSFALKAGLLMCLVCGTVLFQSLHRRDPSGPTSDSDGKSEGLSGPAARSGPGRRLLKLGVLPPVVVNVTVPPADENDTTHGKTIVCTPPAYHEFPPDAFTNEQRQGGAVVVHLTVVIYMFVALAIVCDIYFVASLEKICEKLHLQEDVAGASFMAAGSSAPELFTSIIGVFIAKGDVGIGTIVGSAVFNILFVVGICGILVTQVVMLTWYPLVRDSAYYLLSIIVLILSILDGGIQWYEAFIMLLLYGAYIATMKFNVQIQKWAVAKFHAFKPPVESAAILQISSEKKFYGGPGNYEMFMNEVNGPSKTPVDQRTVIPVDELLSTSLPKLSFEDACFRFMKGRRFKPLTRFRTAALIIICERRKLLRDPNLARRLNLKPLAIVNAVEMGAPVSEEPTISDEWKRVPSTEEGVWAMLKWVATTPLCALLYYTVPDCRQQRWDRWFMVTFVMAIVWIAVFSYIMVWMVVLVGFTLGIPDSIMGITFLAAGTSVPDAMASVMVARQGQGDMAVSNTLGSNVFDVLIGLALPWFVQTAMVAPGTTVHINSNGIVFSVVLLFLTVIITLCSIHFGGWKLDKKVGFICLTSYAVFLVFAIMIEFNVFGYVNAPMCTE